MTYCGGRASWIAFSKRAGPFSPTPTTTTRTTRPRRWSSSWRSGAEADDHTRRLQHRLVASVRARQSLFLGGRGRLRGGGDHDGRALGYPPVGLPQPPRREARRPDQGPPPTPVPRRMESWTASDPGQGREAGPEHGGSSGRGAPAAARQASRTLERRTVARGPRARRLRRSREHAQERDQGYLRPQEVLELPPAGAPTGPGRRHARYEPCRGEQG